MDPVTAIVAALAAGAAAAAKDTGKKLVGDAYEGLKALLRRKLAVKPEATTALAQFEKKPEVWKAPLADSLKEAGVDQDAEVLEALKRLVDALGKSGVPTAKFAVTFQGPVKGVVMGDNAKVVQNFGRDAEDEE